MPSHSPAPDRRCARRYNLALPIEIGLPAEDRTTWITGTVRDISSRGIYFASDKSLELGAQVRLRVGLVEEMIAIDAMGKVIRVENHGNATEGLVGAAVTFDTVDIRRNGASGS
jgi:hypothetical protein